MIIDNVYKNKCIFKDVLTQVKHICYGLGILISFFKKYIIQIKQITNMEQCQNLTSIYTIQLLDTRMSLATTFSSNKTII